MTQPRLGPCADYKPDGDGGCHNCVYSHREPSPPLVSVPRWALDAVLTIPVAGRTLTEAFRALHEAMESDPPLSADSAQTTDG